MKQIAWIVVGMGVIACSEPAPVPVPESGAAPPAGHRVVSLSPVGSEIILALGSGARLVAVDRQSAELPGLRDLPVTDATQAASFAPDLVLAPGPEALAVRAAAPNAEVIEVAPHDLDDAYALCRTIGAALFREMDARHFARGLALPLAEISAESFGQRRPRVLAILEVDPLIVAGGHSFATDLIEIAGAESVTHGSEESRLAWSRADLERASPELVVIMRRHELAGPERTRVRESFGPDLPIEFLHFDPERFWLSESLTVARRMRRWIAPISAADPAPSDRRAVEARDR